MLPIIDINLLTVISDGYSNCVECPEILFDLHLGPVVEYFYASAVFQFRIRNLILNRTTINTAANNNHCQCVCCRGFDLIGGSA